MTTEGERLQKVLANAGLGSRREIETWISAGRVKVNGRLAVLGDRVTPADRLRIDQRVLQVGRLVPAPRRVIAYNKPEGELVTRRDPEGRPTAFKNLPPVRQGRWISVGRLDINSSGLLLFTTDGNLANRLMHPARAVEREYAVRVLGHVGEGSLSQLSGGVLLEDGPAHFEEVREAGGSGANHWYHVILREGRQREVRRMWEAVGVRVSRLIRVRYGNVRLGNRLRAGRWRDLEPPEVNGLLDAVGLSQDEPLRPSPGARRRVVKSAQRRRGRRPKNTGR